MCWNCKTKLATFERNTKQMGVCFAVQKKKSDILFQDTRNNYFKSEKARTRYRLCGMQEVFGIYQDEKGEVYKKHIWGNDYYCQDKLCPFCSKRIVYNKRKKVMEFLNKKPELLKKNRFYIVLTVKHTREDSLNDVWDKLHDAKKMLSNKSRKDKYNMKHWKGSKSFFWWFDGIYWAIETTKTKNWWNVHLNILWCTDDDLKLETITTKDKDNKDKEITISRALMEEWKSTTKDSKITSCTKLDMSTTQTKQWAIQEVFKYSLKDDWMYPSQKVEFANFTRGKRMMWWWGELQSMLSSKDSDFITMDDTMDDILNDELQATDPWATNDQEQSKKIEWDKMNFLWTVKYSFSWNGKNVVYNKTQVSILDPGVDEYSLWLPDQYVFKDNEVFVS